MVYSFQDLFIVFIFRSLIMMCLSIDFFCLGFVRFLESIGLSILPIWGSLQPLFFKHFFSPTVFLFSFYDFIDANVRSLVLVVQVHELLFIFVPVWLLSIVNIVYFLLDSSSLILSSVLILLLSPSIKFLIMVIL